MKHLRNLSLTAAAFALAASAVFAQDDAPPQTLFTNVHVFDGVNEARIENASVLVEGNLIKTVSTDVIDAPNATVIDGGGRTLMPGMHDQHVHLLVFNPLSDGLRQNITPFHLGGVATIRSERILMNGFTTVRDLGGPAKSIARIIDTGMFPGPRIYSSEAFITQTSGHADFRKLNDRHPTLSGQGP